MADYVTCGKCQADLTAEPQGQPCPKCGETSARIIGVSQIDTQAATDSLRHRQKAPGVKKPVSEGMSGWEESRDGSGRLVKKSWLIDRQRDPPWYSERVEDARTGEVLRECSEPLADHTGRGSAKREDKSGK